MSRQAVSDALAMLKGMEKLGKQAAKLQADALEKAVEGTPVQGPLKTIRSEVESVLNTVEGSRPELESRLQETLAKSLDTTAAAAQQAKSMADAASQQVNEATGAAQNVAQQGMEAAQMALHTAQSTAQEALHQINNEGVAGLASVATAQATAIFENFQKIAMPGASTSTSYASASGMGEEAEEEESESDAILREEMAKWEAEVARSSAAASLDVAAVEGEVMLESVEGEVMAGAIEEEVVAAAVVEEAAVDEVGDGVGEESETDKLLAEEIANFQAAAQQAAAAAAAASASAQQKREFSTWAHASPAGIYNKFLLLARFNAIPPSKYQIMGGVIQRQLFQGGLNNNGTLGGAVPTKSITSTNFLTASPVAAVASLQQRENNVKSSTMIHRCSTDSVNNGTNASVARKNYKPPPKASDLKLKKSRPKLSDISQEKRVPTGRVERLASYTGLAAGLAVGGLAEMTKRAVGISGGGSPTSSNPTVDSSVLLNPANAERIVKTLCRVRGAALKLGQMLSISDSSLISPELHSIFDRVRQGADFMPWAQTETVLTAQLGHEWRQKVVHFDKKPFAAASIGQVHMGELKDGKQVAIKIQYPGVAEGIDSDINNLVTILNATRLIPDGLFLDELVRVARKELAWEVNYIREKEASNHFRKLLADDPVFYVPEVIDDLSSARVLTTEFLEGVPLDSVSELDCLETRNLIGEEILRLTLTELFEWRCMQTDPNWSNFLYWTDKNKIGLIDFGASRYFTTKFVDDYVRIINSAALGDKEGILSWSKEVGFITGYEAKPLLDAHVDAIMILGEAFQFDKPFDFGNNSTIGRVTNIIPAILTHRLTAPPEEVYSLHRKMAGVFLLCTRLKCNMNIKHLWDEIWSRYEFGRPDLPEVLLQNAGAEVKSVSGR